MCMEQTSFLTSKCETQSSKKNLLRQSVEYFMHCINYTKREQEKPLLFKLTLRSRFAPKQAQSLVTSYIYQLFLACHHLTQIGLIKSSILQDILGDILGDSMLWTFHSDSKINILNPNLDVKMFIKGVQTYLESIFSVPFVPTKKMLWLALKTLKV